MPSCKSLRRRANAWYISFFTLYGGQFTFLTQLLTLNYLLYSPPTQQQSFFRNLPLYSWGNRVFLGGWEFLFPWLQLIVSSKWRFYLFLTFVMLPCTDVEKLILMPSRDYSLELYLLVTWLRIVPTLTAPTTAPARKDSLGTDSHARAC